VRSGPKFHFRRFRFGPDRSNLTSAAVDE